MRSSSRSLQELGCPARMFLMSLCTSEDDLARLGVVLDPARCRVSPGTAARTALHRACAEDPHLARGLADMLDLRHLDAVAHVRAHSADELALEVRSSAETSTGPAFVGWAWALVTDARADVALLGQRLMAEAYVRGMQLLARGAS